MFLAVDDVEAVRNRGLHIGDLKVEPLMVVVGVDVRIKNQVVLVLADLNRLVGNKAGSDEWGARLKGGGRGRKR